MTAVRLGARQRALVAVGAVLIVPLGLGMRALPGIVGDVAGGIAYVLLIAALVVVAMPRLRPGIASAAAVVCACGVELLQLTSIPREIAERAPAVRHVLGATFSWADLVVSVVGGVAALAALRLVRPALERPA